MIKFLFDVFYKIRLYHNYNSAKIYGAVFEGANKIGIRTLVNNSKIGYATYIGSDSNLCDCVIGRYCSISNNVNVVQGVHPTKDWVSTHPAFFSLNKQSGFTYVSKNKFAEFKYFDKQNLKSVLIGNDVWIGYGVIILPGLTIGDGAIIGAGSIVTKNVPPYAIVAGNPAKIIKYRFNHDDIDFLLTNRWWEKDKEWIKEYHDSFEDIELYKNVLSNEVNNER